MNIDEMSLESLLDLRVKVENQIEKQKYKYITEAQTAIEKAASQFGFSVGEISSIMDMRSHQGSRGIPKYANPNDKAQTWTGKGRKPNWFIDALAAGVDPEQMEV